MVSDAPHDNVQRTAHERKLRSKKKTDLSGPYIVKNTLIEMLVTPSGDQISGPVSNF